EDANKKLCWTPGLLCRALQRAPLVQKDPRFLTAAQKVFVASKRKWDVNQTVQFMERLQHCVVNGGLPAIGTFGVFPGLLVRGEGLSGSEQSAATR
ncbi:unnamed protein product, partial [Amoebophrya sp. A25]